ncbi:hypothetical protein BD779DRAFT_1682135 [Infundibulicybe gibba]|nr:hypothetical protein BD779DRAFT_1682135 [Infundibulicybe gibba]
MPGVGVKSLHIPSIAMQLENSTNPAVVSSKWIAHPEIHHLRQRNKAYVLRIQSTTFFGSTTLLEPKADMIPVSAWLWNLSLRAVKTFSPIYPKAELAALDSNSFQCNLGYSRPSFSSHLVLQSPQRLVHAQLGSVTGLEVQAFRNVQDSFSPSPRKTEAPLAVGGETISQLPTTQLATSEYAEYAEMNANIEIGAEWRRIQPVHEQPCLPDPDTRRPAGSMGGGVQQQRDPSDVLLGPGT